MSFISTIATSVAALAALATAVIAIWQTRVTTSVQTLLTLESRWTADAMIKWRSKAAHSLLAGNPGVEVDRILDFFETLFGIFVRKKIVPADWINHTFFWDAACYWIKCKDHVKMVQSAPSEADAWKDYGAAMAKWIGAEKHPPTDEDARKFMVDEVNQGRETTS